MATHYKWTIKLGILAPILAVICIFLTGAGHGWYEPMMILFPWATLNTIWEDQLSIPLLIAGIFQFPIYGFLIDKTKDAKKREWVLFGILVSHILLAIVILWLRTPTWQ